MIHYSYIIIDQSSPFGSHDEPRHIFAFLKQCGYEGVELNLTEPPEVDFGRLGQWLADIGLIIPSFLTGEA